MKTTRTQLTNKGKFRQAGLTLIETLVALTIFALVVGGAIALFGSASTSQSTTQFTSDLNSMRAGTKSVYFGQGGYGTTSLGEVLINGQKVPTTMSITGTAPNRVINHSLNGTVTVTGVNSQFTVAVSNIPTAVCLGLATMNGWDSVKVGAAAARTPPVSPAQASTDCSAAANQTITFTGS
jgi:prepilin-type N-terminal cleavage/methylation domain-containing protein